MYIYQGDACENRCSLVCFCRVFYLNPRSAEPRLSGKVIDPFPAVYYIRCRFFFSTRKNTMIIGMTYDLRSDYLAMGLTDEETAEFDRESTVEAIAGALSSLGHTPVRIGNIYSLVRHLACGERWDMVFNICEGLCGYGRESQVPALLEAYGIPCTFSDPMILAASLHKPTTKRLVESCGVPTPAFAVVDRIDDIGKISLPFPLFAKPAAEGTSKGISDNSVIRSKGELDAVCRDLLLRFNQPVLVETFLSGREFTVGIIGTGELARAVAVMEVTLRSSGVTASVYSCSNKENCEELIDYKLAGDELARRSADVALAAWRGLGCRDAGRVDVRADNDGNPQFIEVNPLAGLHPGHSDLPIMWSLSGKEYVRLIGEIVASVCARPPLMEKRIQDKIHKAVSEKSQA
jgi:D-alanine-D-alanine ligase